MLSRGVHRGSLRDKWGVRGLNEACYLPSFLTVSGQDMTARRAAKDVCEAMATFGHEDGEGVETAFVFQWETPAGLTWWALKQPLNVINRKTTQE